MVDLAMPAVNFYSMLSGLGDTIQANRVAQAKKDAFAAATTPGPDGNIDYPKAILGMAQVDPQAATLLAAVQSHKDAMAHQNWLDQHTLSREKVEDDWSDTTREDSLKAHADSVALQKATLANATNRPFEVDAPGPFGTTTKTTVVRGPNGSYQPINLNSGSGPGAAPSGGGMFGGMSKPVGWDASAAPQAAPPQPAIAPTAVASAAPASFGDRFSAASPQSVAPAAPPAVPAPQANAPANLDAIDPTTGRREAWLKTQPPAEATVIQKVADGKLDPKTLPSNMRYGVTQAVLHYMPGYDQSGEAGGLSLTPVYGKDKDGNTVLLQMGKNGVAAQSKLPEGVTLNGADNETIAADAARLNAGDPNVLKKYSSKGQGRVDLLRLNNEANRQRVAAGQDPIDITQNYITTQGDVARERTSGTMEGRMAPASIEAQGAFKIAQNSLDNLWRTNSVPANRLLQMGEAALSNPELKAAKVATNTAVMTYSRAIAPTGVGTVDAQQHAREILDTADGPAATKAAFAQLSREVDMAHASPGIARQYFAAARKARLEGKPAPEMPQYQPAQPAALSAPPEAIAALKQDPRRAADFDAYYGAGAARAALSGGR